MSLDHILLGMLRRPATGYELGRQFQESAGMFWFAERSQIYPALRRLHDRGLLSCRAEPSSRGPERRVYETTDTGREELREWLREGAHLGRERFAYLAQTFLLGELDSAEESLAVIEQMRTRWSQKLGMLELVQRQMKSESPETRTMDAECFHRYAALRLGLLQVRARIRWCDDTIAELRQRLPQADLAVEKG